MRGRHGERGRLRAAGRTRLIGLVPILVLACADPSARTVAGAPELGDAADADVRGAMWRLAARSARVEDLALDRGGPERRRDEIVALLDDLDRTLDRLEAQRDRVSGPAAELISSHAETFRQDVAAARADAVREPPDLARAASIRASCLHCHGGH